MVPGRGCAAIERKSLQEGIENDFLIEFEFYKMKSSSNIAILLHSRRVSRRVRSLSVPSIREIEDTDDTKLVYPNNLTTMNLYYFLLAPTLCYEMQYPRYVSTKRLCSTILERSVSVSTTL